jgi:predicted 2-oxoglutarate/Fe(II)-dependent dioxygenase YbiX
LQYFQDHSNASQNSPPVQPTKKQRTLHFQLQEQSQHVATNIPYSITVPAFASYQNNNISSEYGDNISITSVNDNQATDNDLDTKPPAIMMQQTTNN